MNLFFLYAPFLLLQVGPLKRGDTCEGEVEGIGAVSVRIAK
jgi:2-keto-4-pentenoate hydratase/2-oxohepta-3-ene-1,7-dioic acid hydratase in catechol pathway